MRKKFIVFFIFLLSISIITLNNVAYAEEDYYILGGFPAGFSMSERGAKVLQVCDVLTENGLVSPAKECDVKENDIILSIDGCDINSGKELSNEIKGKNDCNITLKSENEILTKKITICKDINGLYKIGVIIKECPSGIGTITYFHNGTFASLGHPVLDDENNIMNIFSGKVYDSQITGCSQGKRGRAGELRGIIFKDKFIGDITKNTTTGVYGKIDSEYKIQNEIKVQVGVAEIGDAEIYSTTTGTTPKKYSVSIIKTDGLFSNEKNLLIKVNDENLIDVCGGIVQGMSGSPIVQNGKIVGAVTHVFVNDPTRGYGIKIQDMINNY